MSKFDGRFDEDDLQTQRELIPVTIKEDNGHMKRDEEEATAQERNKRHPFKELPLTGAYQSSLPEWRLSKNFGQITPPDPYGYYDQEQSAGTEVSVALINCHKEYETDAEGKVAPDLNFVKC